LFHNSNVFGSFIIHILFAGCAKIKKINPAPKVNIDINNYIIIIIIIITIINIS